MTDYKALYEAQVQENEMLRDLIQNKMPVGCIAETTYQPILDENEKLKEKIICLESDSMNEVSQAEFDDMVQEKDAEIKEIKKKCMKSVGKLAREKKDLKKELADLRHEEEVDTCAKCNKKRECLSDMFITHDETMTGGEKYMMCGMCSLNHFT